MAQPAIGIGPGGLSGDRAGHEFSLHIHACCRTATTFSLYYALWGKVRRPSYPSLQTIPRTSVRPQPRAFYFDLDLAPLAPAPVVTGHKADGVLIPQSPANLRGRR